MGVGELAHLRMRSFDSVVCHSGKWRARRAGIYNDYPAVMSADSHRVAAKGACGSLGSFEVGLVVLVGHVYLKPLVDI